MLQNLTSFMFIFFLVIFIVIGFIGLMFAGFYLFVLWIRHRGREVDSLNSTLLQVTCREIMKSKLMPAEQLFSALQRSRLADF